MPQTPEALLRPNFVITVIPARESISEWDRLDRLFRTREPLDCWPDHSATPPAKRGVRIAPGSKGPPDERT
jgi:hypothetical protein